MSNRGSRIPSDTSQIRYAVVGLGHIAQVAMLPAFRHATANSSLVALVSDDAVKLKKLSRVYDVDLTFSYEDFDKCLDSGEVDAVYIALPNHLHREYAVRAAEAGLHVLCEKPLALCEDDCIEIIQACAENDVKLMTAYRLHFERANLEVIQSIRSGRIGEPRIFNSLFTMQVKEGNIRLQRDTGGGTLWDIGIYCINAARYIFRAEPIEVCAFCGNSGQGRFEEVEEMSSALLRFPDDRLAAFTCSFGAADNSTYEVVGTKGTIRATNAYEYAQEVALELVTGKKNQKRVFGKRDQFGAELLYFSDCVLKDRDPEPSGFEGLLDVHIIRSLYESARLRQPMNIHNLSRRRRPSLRQEIKCPPVSKPSAVHVRPPTR